MKIGNVLSLFDGMSCGQIALERAGIEYDNYYASEIDPYTIAVTQHNYPHTVQLGDVQGLRGADLPKIDLIMGGSPCQGFSLAGRQLNFDDPRSKLFFQFVRLLEECSPRYFLLENVKMRAEFQNVISDYLSVEPIEIDSTLVSAQSRKRLYWTNIPSITQPEDKGLLLKDIIERNLEPQIPANSRYVPYNCESKYVDPYNCKEVVREKSTALRTNFSNGNLWVNTEAFREKAPNLGCKQVGVANLNGHDFLKRVCSVEGKCPTLTAVCGGNQERKIAVDALRWRKITPRECERLQTLPDDYTLVPWKNRYMSNSQRYKMLGNGWTVDVIAHILKNIGQNNKSGTPQDLFSNLAVRGKC